jgi:isopentenyl-diphosphate delta-isomerase
MSNNTPTTESRKVDHIRINLEKDVQFPNLTTGLENYRFIHNALPELDLNAIDTSVTVFGKKLSSPLFISSMTGGTGLAKKINENLALAAQKQNIAMGLGSQRAAVEDSLLADSYTIRNIAPDILLFANIGAVQFNYGYGVEQCRRAVDMVNADALILHLNVLQEAVQPEGDTDFRDLIRKIEEVVRTINVPVIIKEVGWGFSEETARILQDIGVSAIDVAGAGGTSWSIVEYHRAPSDFHAKVAVAFSDWGIPTADAVKNCVTGAPNLPIFASGGLRDGIDIAKSIALGATLAGIAGPVLHVANESVEAVEEFIQITNKQLQVAMLCSGIGNITDLQHTPKLMKV